MPIIKVTDDNEWYTPKYLVDYFGKFDYDPASNDYWAKVLQIPNYDTKETDGLKTDWTKYKRIWINPPYTQKKEFLAKAVETYNKAKNDIFILLPVNFIVTKTFANTFIGGEIYIPDIRVKFTSGNGKKASQSPSFGHVIIKIEDGNNKYHLIKMGDLENGNASWRGK